MRMGKITTLVTNTLEMRKTMLAIVIPYFKLKFFEEALQSLVSQTNKEFNVYIGNDASPQDPLQVLSSFEDRLNFNYKRFETNRGLISLTQQWDRCLAMVNDEEWVMILGDDDTFDSQVVENFYRNLPLFTTKSNVVRFSSRIVFSDKDEVSKSYRHPEWEDAGRAFMRRFRQETRSSLSEYIFRKDAYKKYGFYNYPLAWHSDDRAWLEFAENKPIYSINDAVVYFRHSTHNITGKVDNLKEKDTATEEFYKYLAGDTSYFTREEKLMFARIYERSLRSKGSVSYKGWWDLAGLYFQNFEPGAFTKMLKRIMREKILNKEVTI